MERMKMPRIKRAIQFAPFDALKGLHEALKRKELENIERQKRDSICEPQDFVSPDNQD